MREEPRERSLLEIADLLGIVNLCAICRDPADSDKLCATHRQLLAAIRKRFIKFGLRPL